MHQAWSASDRASLGRFLKGAAQAHSLTQATLAVELGVKREMLSRVYSGRVVKPDLYLQLMEALGIDT